ncbi:serine/threonine-protein kinase [Actinacidiphila acidipaludis]|nr:serine/threonine-protein kinase [Streptomyces acidipaludis]
MFSDRYRLDAPLGRGGMGEVWRAWDTRLGRPVAVKVLAGPASVPEDAVARFQHEARTAARLSHPHIVGVYDVGAADDRSFLVMELVPGRSLAQELREEGPLSLARVAEVATQTAEGLAAAHRRGIVHRDIKPSNLLTGEGGSVKIADFGIARSESGETTVASTVTGTVLGTTLYLSPEAARGGHAGSPGDIYALGCSLYELLTGRPPFTGEHPIAILRRHVEDAPVPPRDLRPDIPRRLDAYLLRMLAKQPGERPTAAEAAEWFADDAWQDELPDTTRRLAAVEPPARPVVPAVQAAGTPGQFRTAPQRTKGRRLAPTAGTVTAAAAIAAATLVFASPTADGNSPTLPTRPSSSQKAGTSAHHAGAGPAAAADADVRRPSRGAAGAPGPKRPAPPTSSAPTTAPSHPGPTSAAPVHPSSPVTGPPKPAPHPTTPPPTDSGSAPGPSASPSAPSTPPPTSPDPSPPADGSQGE